jgi:hypothetical protein
MTYALRVTRSLALHALAAPIAQEIALIALTALGLSGDPFHEPFHVQRRRVRMSWCWESIVFPTPEDRWPGQIIANDKGCADPPQAPNPAHAWPPRSVLDAKPFVT